MEHASYSHAGHVSPSMTRTKRHWGNGSDLERKGIRRAIIQSSIECPASNALDGLSCMRRRSPEPCRVMNTTARSTPNSHRSFN